MKINYENVKDHNEVVIYGAGNLLERCISLLDPKLKIIAVADNDCGKWGKVFTERKLPCIRPGNITEGVQAVIIAVDAPEAVLCISEELDKRGIEYCHIRDAVRAYLPVYDAEILDKMDFSWHEKPYGKMMKFIDITVPVAACNLKCSYCYLQQEYRTQKPMLHTPKYIRAALSQERLGGSAFLNFCGTGETMLLEELVPVFEELLREGHYIQVVTNGTITQGLDRLFHIKADLTRIFIKFSFHYLEFKRLDLLTVFSENVKKARQMGCSVSVELAPNDELIPYIDEVKEFSVREFGVLPHLTVTRDQGTSELKILSRYTNDEYYNIWKSFDSSMFNFKMENLGKRRVEHCMAGVYSPQLDLESGNLYKCAYNPLLDNIYRNLREPIYLEAVGEKCCLPYCFNCHAYLALGLIEEIPAPTYYELRDRVTGDGQHWVNSTLKEVFTQKLFENNC